mgnify:CR=1 FL=1
MAADSRLQRAGVAGFNKPKRTPSHKTKSHVVVAKSGDKLRLSGLDNKVLVEQERILRQLKIKQEENHSKLDTQRIYLVET